MKTIFVWDFPHFVNASETYLFVCPREQSVCHMVSSWRVDWVPLAKCFCAAAISVITLTGCCFLVSFDLFLGLRS